MNITVIPRPLKGTINAPSSKSITHRAIICASVSKGNSIIVDPLLANDTMETIDALKNLGAQIYQDQNKLLVSGISNDLFLPISFKESASSLRMVLPFVLFKRGKSILSLDETLMNRITKEELILFDEAILDYENKTLMSAFNFDKKVYNIRGNATSQWASGFLLLLPLLENKKILLDQGLQNNSYLSLTKEVMSHFNIKLLQEDSMISTTSRYQNTTFTVEGDWSNGALWLVLKDLGESIEVTNLSHNSIQGDKEIINILKKMKTESTIDLSNNLDLALLVASRAALAPQKITTLTGLKRLIHKESNRYQAIIEILNAFNIKYTTLDDEITIWGKEILLGDITKRNFTFDSKNDHRVIMALLVLSSKCEMPITILNAEAIKKSYPTLYDDYQKLGGLLIKE